MSNKEQSFLNETSWLKKKREKEKERQIRPYFLILLFHFNHCISTVYALTFFNIACSVNSTNIEYTNIHNSTAIWILGGK